MDRAGWHTTAKLTVPNNITVVLLPSRSPELNPMENVWQYMRHVWTALRWQGLFRYNVLRSVRPCVRPIDAAHMGRWP